MVWVLTISSRSFPASRYAKWAPAAATCADRACNRDIHRLVATAQAFPAGARMTATQAHPHDGRRQSRDRLEVVALFAAIALLHVVGFGTLVSIVAPHHYRVGEQV